MSDDQHNHFWEKDSDDSGDFLICMGCLQRRQAPPPSPEHDKFAKVESAAQAIGGFLDWLLSETPYHIAEYPADDVLRERLFPVHKSESEWIALYFGIDYAAYMKEKTAYLEWFREMNEKDEQ